MDPAFERLELASLFAALSARVQTPLGKQCLDALQPCARHRDAAERMHLSAEARHLLDQLVPAPVWGAEDVGPSLEQGEKGLMLEGPALRAIARTMQAGTRLRAHLLEHETIAPRLYGWAASLVDLSRPASEILRCFDSEGQLADDASPDIGPLRRKVRRLRENISERIVELQRALEKKDYLQEAYFTIRADRYVLPIKASYKNAVEGIVHDASGTGQTVFIEPQAVVDLGNRLKIAQSELREEEHRILSELTLLACAEGPEIIEAMRVVGEIDSVFAQARLFNELRCQAIVPEEVPGFWLVGARHPLLVLQGLERDAEDHEEVVANSFALEEGQSALLITGPNTGGKTVAMKTIGMLAMMVRFGFHIPCAEGSRLGWYNRIEVAIGDQQSIAANLSTFAGHVKELVRIVQSAEPGVLVLVDEIAADTDPNQGQALARSVLERLVEQKAHVVVTTHFESLKALPFADGRFRNAGVGFDPERMAPTYRVTLDVPQGSSAFDIARRLGLSADIVQRARSYLGDGTREIERLRTEMQKRSASLLAAEEEAKQEQERARRAIAEAETKVAASAAKVAKVEAAARDDLITDIAASREEVRRLVARLQSAEADLTPREAMKAANQSADALAKLEKAEREKLPATEAKADAPRRLDSVAIGDWVHVSSLSRDGEVTGLDGKMALLVVGSVKMRAPIKTLLRAKTARPKRKTKKGVKVMSQPPRSPGEPVVIMEELDVRGSTSDEVADRIEAFLDYHYRAPTTHIRVIHGHGTGALRAAVREHLERSGYVSTHRPGEKSEGGDGATVASLS